MRELESRRQKMADTEEILKLFSSTVRGRQFYPEGHSVVKLGDRRLLERLNAFMETEDSWTIVLLGGEFVFEKVPMPKISAIIRPLYNNMNDQMIESITIQKGIEEREIANFITLLLKGRKIWKENSDPIKILKDLKIKNIAIKRVELALRLESFSTNTDQARDIYATSKEALKQLFIDIMDEETQPNLYEFKVVILRLIDALIEDHFAVVSRIHTVHDPDDIIAHCLNTGILAYLTAMGLDIDSDDLPDIMLAGFLHDIGAVDVPIEIQDGKLRASSDKWVYIEHPIRGMGILRNIPGVPTVTEVVAFEHHIHWDGDGFPKLVAKEKTNMASSIISLASTYDQLLHTGKYVPFEQVALRIIEMADTKFDPRIVSRFLIAVGVYPPGTYVKLTTRDVGVVLESGKGEVYRPIVKLLRKADGSECGENELLDLTERDPTTNSYMASVMNSIDPKQMAQ